MSLINSLFFDKSSTTCALLPVSFDSINPGDGGLAEGTAEAGGGPRDPHPITLLKINSYDPNFAC